MAAPSKKKKEKIVAALISDTFTTNLEPMTTSTPQLLLPIANTPLIDYILEGLVVNNIDEVVIFAYSGYSELSHHIKTVSTASGKPWIMSKELKVDLVDCTKSKSSVRSLTDLLADIRGKNKLSGNFILLPCDSLANLRNLKELYQNHVARMESNRNAVLTVVAAKDGGALEMANHRVTMAAWDHQVKQSNNSPTQGAGSGFEAGNTSVTNTNTGGSLPGGMMSPTTMNPRTNSIGSFNFDFTGEGGAGGLNDVEQQHTSRFSVVLDAAVPDSVGNMALVYHGWDDSKGGFGELALGDFVMKKKVFTIRTDLINTGIYICNTEVLSILNAAAQEQTMSDLLRHISDNHEVLNERFAVAIAPNNTTVGYINSTSAYVATNIIAVQRHLFPLTRESNFADSQPNYLVARSNPSIFLHERRLAKEATETRVSSKEVGPDVVVGLHTVVPSSAAVARTVLGRHVTLGKKVRLFGCVILNDVIIGDNVEITNSVIGSNVFIAPGTTICAGCIVGNGVQIAGETGDLMVPGGTRLMVPGGFGGTSPNPVGAGSKLSFTAKGKGVLWVPPVGSRGGADAIPALDELFQNDYVGGDESDHEGGADMNSPGATTAGGDVGGKHGAGGEDGEKDQQNFLDGVTGAVEKVLGEEGLGIDNVISALKFVMLTYHRVRIDLAAAVLTVTFKLVLADCDKNGITKSKEVCQAIIAALGKLAPVFSVEKMEDIDEEAIRSRSGLNPILEAFAEAVHAADVTTTDDKGKEKTKNVVQKKADTILSFLFWEIDDKLFNKQGYCAISEKSIIAFDDFIAELWDEVREAHGEKATLDDMEPEDRTLAAGWDCVYEYVETVREERKARKKAEKEKKKKKLAESK